MVENGLEHGHPSNDTRPKAVIFTHFGGLKYDAFLTDDEALTKKYTQIIEAYLGCKRIGIVYTYVSWVVQKAVIAHKPDQEYFIIPPLLLKQEQELINEASTVLAPADNYGGRMAFLWVSPLAFFTGIVFIIWFIRDKRRGGYKIQTLD